MWDPLVDLVDWDAAYAPLLGASGELSDASLIDQDEPSPESLVLPGYTDELPDDSRPTGTKSYSSSRDGANDNERLIDRTTDPTSWLLEFRFREQWNWPLDASGPDTQAFEFRPSIPFKAWDHVNLLRVSVPYDVSNPAGQGLGTVQIYDLIVFEERWGRWGVGPLVQFAPHSNTGKDEFQIGPVAGAVTKSTHWTVGVLSQNFLSGNVSQSRLQPIVTYKIDDRWALGLGETEIRYDWHAGNWTQLPLGIEVDYLAEVFGQKIKLFVDPQHNFQSDSSNSGWTVFAGFSLLAPEQ